MRLIVILIIQFFLISSLNFSDAFANTNIDTLGVSTKFLQSKEIKTIKVSDVLDLIGYCPPKTIKQISGLIKIENIDFTIKNKKQLKQVRTLLLFYLTNSDVLKFKIRALAELLMIDLYLNDIEPTLKNQANLKQTITEISKFFKELDIKRIFEIKQEAIKEALLYQIYTLLEASFHSKDLGLEKKVYWLLIDNKVKLPPFTKTDLMKIQMLEIESLEDPNEPRNLFVLEKVLTGTIDIHRIRQKIKICYNKGSPIVKEKIIEILKKCIAENKIGSSYFFDMVLKNKSVDNLNLNELIDILQEEEDKIVVKTDLIGIPLDFIFENEKGLIKKEPLAKIIQAIKEIKNNYNYDSTRDVYDKSKEFLNQIMFFLMDSCIKKIDTIERNKSISMQNLIDLFNRLELINSLINKETEPLLKLSFYSLNKIFITLTFKIIDLLTTNEKKNNSFLELAFKLLKTDFLQESIAEDIDIIYNKKIKILEKHGKYEDTFIRGLVDEGRALPETDSFKQLAENVYDERFNDSIKIYNEKIRKLEEHAEYEDTFIRGLIEEGRTLPEVDPFKQLSEKVYKERFFVAELDLIKGKQQLIDFYLQGNAKNKQTVKIRLKEVLISSKENKYKITALEIIDSLLDRGLSFSYFEKEMLECLENRALDASIINLIEKILISKKITEDILSSLRLIKVLLIKSINVRKLKSQILNLLKISHLEIKQFIINDLLCLLLIKKQLLFDEITDLLNKFLINPTLKLNIINLLKEILKTKIEQDLKIRILNFLKQSIEEGLVTPHDFIDEAVARISSKNLEIANIALELFKIMMKQKVNLESLKLDVLFELLFKISPENKLYIIKVIRKKIVYTRESRRESFDIKRYTLECLKASDTQLVKLGLELTLKFINTEIIFKEIKDVLISLLNKENGEIFKLLNLVLKNGDVDNKLECFKFVTIMLDKKITLEPIKQELFNCFLSLDTATKYSALEILNKKLFLIFKEEELKQIASSCFEDNINIPAINIVKFMIRKNWNINIFKETIINLYKNPEEHDIKARIIDLIKFLFEQTDIKHKLLALEITNQMNIDDSLQMKNQVAACFKIKIENKDEDNNFKITVLTFLHTIRKQIDIEMAGEIKKDLASCLDKKNSIEIRRSALKIIHFLIQCELITVEDIETEFVSCLRNVSENRLLILDVLNMLPDMAKKGLNIETIKQNIYFLTTVSIKNIREKTISVIITLKKMGYWIEEEPQISDTTERLGISTEPQISDTTERLSTSTEPQISDTTERLRSANPTAEQDSQTSLLTDTTPKHKIFWKKIKKKYNHTIETLKRKYWRIVCIGLFLNCFIPILSYFGSNIYIAILFANIVCIINLSLLPLFFNYDKYILNVLYRNLPMDTFVYKDTLKTIKYITSFLTMVLIFTIVFYPFHYYFFPLIGIKQTVAPLVDVINNSIAITLYPLRIALVSFYTIFFQKKLSNGKKIELNILGVIPYVFGLVLYLNNPFSLISSIFSTILFLISLALTTPFIVLKLKSSSYMLFKSQIKQHMHLASLAEQDLKAKQIGKSSFLATIHFDTKLEIRNKIDLNEKQNKIENSLTEIQEIFEKEDFQRYIGVDLSEIRSALQGIKIFIGKDQRYIAETQISTQFKIILDDKLFETPKLLICELFKEFLQVILYSNKIYEDFNKEGVVRGEVLVHLLTYQFLPNVSLETIKQKYAAGGFEYKKYIINKKEVNYLTFLENIWPLIKHIRSNPEKYQSLKTDILEEHDLEIAEYQDFLLEFAKAA
jgi:hypothetical protein